MPLLQGFIFVERNTNKTILYMSLINKASLILSRFFFLKNTILYMCLYELSFTEVTIQNLIILTFWHPILISLFSFVGSKGYKNNY